jgi:RHS repeat-associated protein
MMFTGQYFDTEIDQYYLRARQYDPHISRFTARDPIRGKFEEPMTLHLYLYCTNDPVDNIDPWGLDSVALYDATGDGAMRGLSRLNAADDFDWAFPVTSPEHAAQTVEILSMICGMEIDDLYIFDHGYAGVDIQGRQEIGDVPLNWGSDAWRRIASGVEKEGTIHLRGCNIAAGNKLYIWLLAQTGGRKVDGFDNLTYFGNSYVPGFPDYYSFGGLWLAIPGVNEVFNISKETPYGKIWRFGRW